MRTWLNPVMMWHEQFFLLEEDVLFILFLVLFLLFSWWEEEIRKAMVVTISRYLFVLCSQY
jgi:hypothetical protein